MPFLINRMKNLFNLRQFLKNIHDPEDQDAEVIAHPEVNKGQDTIATAYPEGPEDLDADSIFFPEVPAYHEVLDAGYRDDGNIQNTSDYYTTMYMDVPNIDKN